MGDGVFSLDEGAVSNIVSAHKGAISAAEDMKQDFNAQKMRDILNNIRGLITDVDPEVLDGHQSLSDGVVLPKTEELEDDIDLIKQRASEAETHVTSWHQAVTSTDEDSSERVSKVETALSEVNVNWEPSN